MPAAGALGALWLEVLSSSAAATLVAGSADEATEGLLHLLEGLAAAAVSVRPRAPGVLVGPRGETVEKLPEAVTRMRAVLEGTVALPSGKARRLSE